MQRLRQRFASIPHENEDDEQSLQTDDDATVDSDDYFGRMAHHRGSSVGSGTLSVESRNAKTPMPTVSPETARPKARFAETKQFTSIPQVMSPAPLGTRSAQTQATPGSNGSPETPFKFLHPSRSQVQAGDLHTMAGQLSESETYRPGPGSRTVSYANRRAGNARKRGTSITVHAQEGEHAPQATTGMDFDLRDEVMSSIAKSIGLIQPPLSGSISAGPSPMLSPSRPGVPRSAFPSSASITPSSSRSALRNTALFGTAFGNLSYLQSQDDTSSVTSLTGTGPSTLSGLDNDVEILFYSAGSSLVRAGEKNAGACLTWLLGLTHSIICFQGYSTSLMAFWMSQFPRTNLVATNPPTFLVGSQWHRRIRRVRTILAQS